MTRQNLQTWRKKQIAQDRRGATFSLELLSEVREARTGSIVQAPPLFHEDVRKTRASRAGSTREDALAAWMRSKEGLAWSQEARERLSAQEPTGMRASTRPSSHGGVGASASSSSGAGASVGFL